MSGIPGAERDRLNRIAQIKDELVALDARRKELKAELELLMPNVQKFMETKQIDVLQGVGNGKYKVCRKTKTRQPSISRTFIMESIHEYLLKENVRTVDAKHIVAYIYERRKSLAEQVENCSLMKAPKPRVSKRARVPTLPIESDEEEQNTPTEWT